MFEKLLPKLTEPSPRTQEKGWSIQQFLEPSNLWSDGLPDLDEFWQDLSSKLNGLLGGKRGGQGGRGGMPVGGGRNAAPSGRSLLSGLAIVGVVAGLAWLGSGFYIVQEGQVAAVLRFGQFRYLDRRAHV